MTEQRPSEPGGPAPGTRRGGEQFRQPGLSARQFPPDRAHMASSTRSENSSSVSRPARRCSRSARTASSRSLSETRADASSITRTVHAEPLHDYPLVAIRPGAGLKEGRMPPAGPWFKST